MFYGGLRFDRRSVECIKQYFLQEAENNMNEQIAHFVDQRNETANTMREHLAAIQVVCNEMRDTEKECRKLLFEGIRELTDQRISIEPDQPLPDILTLSSYAVSCKYFDCYLCSVSFSCDL